jgi:UDP-N-acetylmuramoylalanine--D-glutamate ligase
MKIAVIGAGKSGIAAAILAKKLGNEVFLSELSDASKYQNQIDVLKSHEIDFEFGINSDKVLDSELVITSPGVPPYSPLIMNVEKKNIPIISELEYAFQNLKGNKIIAITGTNGKTTTTSLIAFILNQSGKKAIECGNIGLPMCELIPNLVGDEILVVETSSYQLDRIQYFQPDIALILNISPDHLKYHGTYQQYIDAKWKISQKQNKNNLLILNLDDHTLGGTSNHIEAKVNSTLNYFSLNNVEHGICVRDGFIVFVQPFSLFKSNSSSIEEVLMPVSELSLPGTHNLYNSMAAALAARAFEIKNEDIRDALMKFQGVEHRLENVRILNSIKFVNDSKATNINATWFALSSYQNDLIWLAGGQGDNNDYSSLDELVSKNVKEIITFGDERQAIFNHFCSIKRCNIVENLEEAVALAYSIAKANDVILFSPACKSFDMFANYEHRGQVFKSIVNKL